MCPCMAVHAHKGDRLKAIEATVLERALWHCIVVELHHGVGFCIVPDVTDSDVAERRASAGSKACSRAPAALLGAPVRPGLLHQAPP